MPPLAQRLLTFILYALLVTLAACDSSEHEDQEQVFGDVVLPSTTEVLPSSDASDLMDVSDDGRVFTFRTSSDFAEDLESGDVIVSGPTSAAPFGFLRKVSSTSRRSGSIEVRTTAATLEDAIEQGSVSVDVVLSAQDVDRAENLAPGVTLLQTAPRGSKAGSELFISLENVIIADRDGDLSTNGDQIRLDGSIGISPSIRFDLDINRSRVQRLEFGAGAEVSADIDVEWYYVSPTSLEWKTEVQRIRFSPIVVPLPPSPFPLVLTPALVIEVGAKGTVSLGIEAGVDYTVGVEGGLTFENGRWTPTSDVSHEFGFDPPRFSASAQAEVFSDLPFSVALYGVAGPFFESRVLLQGTVDPFADPWWTLALGVEAEAGVDVSLLGRTLADHRTRGLIGLEFPIADAGGPFEPGASALAGVWENENTRHYLAIGTDTIDEHFYDSGIMCYDSAVYGLVDVTDDTFSIATDAGSREDFTYEITSGVMMLERVRDRRMWTFDGSSRSPNSFSPTCGTPPIQSDPAALFL